MFSRAAYLRPAVATIARSAACRTLLATTATSTLHRAVVPAPSSIACRCSRAYSSDAASPPPEVDLGKLDNQFLSGQVVKVDELQQLIRAGVSGVGKPVLLVDVRNPDETANGTIPTAVTLPLPELKDALAQPNMQFQLLYQFPKPSRERTNIIFYCQAGRRSAAAEAIARELGFKRIRNYSGSYANWVATQQQQQQ
ncbi:hypothetical protein AMAG_06869 [Allomyces macrogynus ATCC 38327]|uniref:Rhodanese domain-containing protein n=1 Tax=Allomyces macrogynus (strain ATCC 38327) TaxID=578462 RepID=A0A0L0SF02_ALLM3|nr:hypothetical protein AMAG_06869 [Allomyces macrogynus ATCC 38327]|eukprot:KNE61118.1 hypothetical protein AMAG_06869 [Allomyces macrogynus ATCC 38327]